MKNVFGRQKNTEASATPVSSTTRLGTPSRAAQQQQQQQPQQGSVPPGTASRRVTTAQKRPSTAVRAAGFTAGGGAFGSIMAPSGPSQFEKKEER